jgi:hypothetical protein
MALKPAEQQELEALEQQYGSVFEPPRPQPSFGQRVGQFGQQLGQATVQALPEIGGLVGGALTTFGTRNPVLGAEARVGTAGVIRGLVGTGAGALAGTATKQQVEAFQGKSQPLTKQFAEQLSNTINEVTIDAAGNVVFKLGGSLFKVAKEKLPSLGLFGTKATPDIEIKRQVQALLEEEGLGGLTRFQVKPTATSGVVESIGRGGVAGKGTFAKLEEANTTALQNKRDKILNQFTPKIVDDVEAGKSYKEAIKDAQSELSLAANEAYGVIERAGKNVSVDVSPIANDALARLKEAADISRSGTPNIALSDQVVTQLKNISDLKGNITFTQAHKLRSDLNAQLRDVKNEFGSNSPLVAVLSQNINAIEQAMDLSASKLNPKLKEAYRETSNFYRESTTELFPESLAKLNNKTVERVGDTIFATGNVTEIEQLYKSLERAQTINPKLNVGEIKSSLQKNYLSGLIGTEGQETAVASLLSLDKKLQDKKFKRTFDAAIPDEEIRNNIKTLINATKLSQTKPQNTFSLALASAQSRESQKILLAAAAGATGTALYTGQYGLAGTAASAGTILLTPLALAKFATSKSGVRQLLKAEQTYSQALKATGEEKTKLALKTLGFMNEAYKTAGITEEDLGIAKPEQANQAMTPDELKELEMLEQRLR